MTMSFLVLLASNFLLSYTLAIYILLLSSSTLVILQNLIFTNFQIFCEILTRN